MAIANITGNILTDSGVSTSSLISGTGTTNYHAKFTGASTLGNSLIWDNGTNVGIGNTNTSFTFDVTGTGRFTGALTSGALLTNAASGAGGQEALRINNDNGYIGFFNSANSTRTGYLQANASTDITLMASQSIPILFGTAATERMRITSTGNVGIGTSSPTNVLHIQGTGTTYFHIGNSSTGSGSSDGADIGYFTGQTSLNIVQRENDAMIFSTNDTERMRITSGGNLCINTTSKIDDGLISISADANLNQGITIRNTNASNNIYYIFFKNSSNAAAGRIEQTGATSVAYASGSDYRLKEDLKDFDGLNKVLSIKTYDFKWKNEDRRDYGVLAHELQEVVSGAVLGQKDELEEDGTIKTQMVDYSKIVTVLIKAIQELNAKVSALENKS